MSRATSIGWVLFLAFVALTPLVIGALPPQFGPIATVRAYDPFSLPKTVTILVLSGLSLAALCVAVVRREVDVYWHPVLWVAVGLFGWACVSTAFSNSRALSVLGASQRNDGLVALLGYLLVAFLAVQYVRSARALRTVMMTAVLSGVVVSAYALLQYVGVDPYHWTNDIGRVFATFGNADMLGSYLVFPLALALGLAVSSDRRLPSAGWWAAAALTAAALWASATRGGWIGALAVILSFALAGWGVTGRVSRRQIWVFGGLALAVVAAAVGVVLSRPNLAWRSIASSSVLERLSNGRTLIWAIGLRAWLQRPITGWGPDGFVRAFPSAVGASWYALVSGYISVDNAHSFVVQSLVALGLPGLVLLLWLLGQTAVVSFGRVRGLSGSTRLVFASVWSALVGLIVALAVGVSVPEVYVWLWLIMGLLLAPDAHRIQPVPRFAAVAVAAFGIVLAAWAGSWLVADVAAGQAMQMPVGPAQVLALQGASRLNPLAQTYRGLAADALLNQAVAEQRAGESAQIVDETLSRAIAAYQTAAAADPGDALIRAALANLLIGYSKNHPESDAAALAVQTMQQAVALAPNDAAVLVTLARAYQAAGQTDKAQEAARRAIVTAPEYATQALGPLGLGGTP